MSDSETWVAKRVGLAREQSPTVIAEVSEQIEHLLNDKLTSKRLSSKELKSIAESLITAMSEGNSPSTDSKQ
jgi:hypothetical protein